MDDDSIEALQWKLETLEELIERSEQEPTRRETMLLAMRHLRDDTEEKLRRLSL